MVKTLILFCCLLPKPEVKQFSMFSKVENRDTVNPLFVQKQLKFIPSKKQSPRFKITLVTGFNSNAIIHYTNNGMDFNSLHSEEIELTTIVRHNFRARWRQNKKWSYFIGTQNMVSGRMGVETYYIGIKKTIL